MELHTIRLRVELLSLRGKYAELLAEDIDPALPFMIALNLSIHHLENACDALDTGLAPDVCVRDADRDVWHIDISDDDEDSDDPPQYEALCGVDVQVYEDGYTKSQYRVPTCSQCIEMTRLFPDDEEI